MKTQLYTSTLFIVLISFFSLQSLHAQKLQLTASSKKVIKLYDRAFLEYANLEYNNAIKSLKGAVAVDPEFAAGYLFLSHLYDDAAMARQALEKAEKLMAIMNPGEKTMLQIARANYAENLFELQDLYEKWAKNYPQDLKVQYFTAVFFYRNFPDDAMPYIQNVLEINKTFAAAYNLLGYLAMRDKNYVEAEKNFKKYIELRPDYANPYDSYGEVLSIQGKHIESIQQYQKALEINPYFNNAHAGLGWNFLMLNDFKTARVHYKLLKAGSANSEERLFAQICLAISYIVEGKADHAVKEIDIYREISRLEDQKYNELISWAYQGLILTQMGHAERGWDYYQKTIIRIDDAEITDVQRKKLKENALLWECYSLISRQKFNEAKKCLQDVEAHFAKNKENQLNHDVKCLQGFLAFYQNNFDQAIAHLKTNHQDFSIYMFYLAKAYENKKDDKMAKTYYNILKQWEANDIYYALIMHRIK